MKNAANKELAGDNGSRQIIMHHLGSFCDNNLDAVIADYTTESVLITRDGTYKGPKEIKAFFESLMVHFPSQNSDFELDKVVVNNELVYIVWHAHTPSVRVSLGTDTFIVREGRIYQQTFAGLMEFL
jgi:SnoaL-like domain